MMELLLRVLNNCLLHIKLCIAIVLIPTAVMFVLVMWVLTPTYVSEAIVTPPSTKSSIGGGLSKLLDGSSSGLGSFYSLLGGNDQAIDIVYTYLNSWELHNKVIEKFDLVNHYEFDGKFHADLLKMFRNNYTVDMNDEGMFDISIEDEDPKLAAEMVNYILLQADSMYNDFKTNQARLSRLYMDDRLAKEEASIDSLQQVVVKFQTENNFYDPEIQLESTMKYLSSLQSERDAVAQEMSFEKMQRGEQGRRYEELQKRLRTIDASLKQAMEGKRGKVGIIALEKSSELTAQHLRLKNEMKVRETVYKFLREQSEQLRLEEANMQKNLVVLQPAWANDKKVFPIRSVMLLFTCLVSGLFAIFVSCFIERCKNATDGSVFSQEVRRLGAFFGKNKKAE